MAKLGKYDGAILGAILGLVVTTPEIAVMTTDFFNSIIPLKWYVFGDWSLSIMGIIAFGIIGLIVDKTR